MPADAKIKTATVVYDAGHGGHNWGARSKLGWAREEDLTLHVGLQAKKANPDLCLTRECNDTLSFDQRHARARAHGADIVISGHFDSCQDPKKRGLHAYYLRGDGVARSLCRFAVNNAPDELRGGNVISVARDELSVPAKAWKRRAHHVLSAYESFDCVILIEFGYLSNVYDVKYVITTWGLQAMADLINAIAKRYDFILHGGAK